MPGKHAGYFRPDIQGLRALAVMMVIVYHAGLPVPGGFLGVDAFFVISGFVITELLHRELRNSGRINFLAFYRRRFQRLMPALAAVITVTAAASVFFLSPFGPAQNTAQTGLAALLLSANVFIAHTTGGYFDAPARTNALLNTWSLSVEEQFYLFFPFLLAGCWWLSRRTRRLGRAPLLSVVGIAGISFLIAVGADSAWLHLNLSPQWIFYSPVTRAWEFAVGAALALLGARWRLAGKHSALIVGSLGLAALLASNWIITDSMPDPGVWTLLPVLGTAVVIWSGSAASASPLSRVLGSAPMTAIGDRSYSLYLWHWPLIVLLVPLISRWPAPGVLAALASIPLALASYRWLEQPIRSMRVRSGRSFGRLILAIYVPAVLAALALLLGSHFARTGPAGRSLDLARGQQFLADLRGCDAWASLRDVQGRCGWNTQASGRPIYVVGDSNADHLGDGLLLAAQRTGRPLYISTTQNCPFVDAEFRWSGSTEPPQACQQYVADNMDYLTHAPAGTVIISDIDWYWSNPSVSLESPSGTRTTDTSAKLSILRNKLTQQIRQLQNHGNQVVLMQTVPQFDPVGTPYEQASLRLPYVYDPTSCSTLTLLTSGCSQIMPESAALARQGAVRDVLRSVAGQTGATLIDPWPVMCTDAQCSTTVDGIVAYRDFGHLSVAQSAKLAPLFIPALTHVATPARS